MTNDLTMKILGFGLGLFGAFLMWVSGVAIAQYFHAYGFSRLFQLLYDPEYALRMLSAMAAFLAGLAALTERKGGDWLAGLSAGMLLVQTFVIVSNRGLMAAWPNQGIYLIVMTGLFLSLVVFNGDKTTNETIDGETSPEPQHA